MSSGAGSSRGGHNRANKGKAPMVEPQRPTYRQLNVLQDRHRTRNFEEKTPSTLPGGYRFRQHHTSVPWNYQYEPYFLNACLLQTQKIGHIPIEATMISALQERWRPETHTFHMPHGEMTITLDDVSCLLGMRVDGTPLCLNTGDISWVDKATELLGKTPPVNMFRGDKRKSKILVYKKWFMENFSDLENDAPLLRVQQYCRAYIIAFFTDVLFTDSNGDSYSLMPLVFIEDIENLHEWAFGSAVLGYLYRELCKSTGPSRKNMGGCVLLLQLWAWMHFPALRPDVPLTPERVNMYENPDYNDTVGMLFIGATRRDDRMYTHLLSRRDLFDSQSADEVDWAPYEEIRPRLPPICGEERDTCLLSLPLIYMWIVERVRPQRVMRQFGYRQKIPPRKEAPVYDEELHDWQQGRGDNWPEIHKKWIYLWESKWLRAPKRKPPPYDSSQTDAYLRWYYSESDPIVQSQVPHGSRTYRPIVPDKRAAAQSMRDGAAIGLKMFREIGSTSLTEIKAGIKKWLGCTKMSLEQLNEFNGGDEWDILNTPEGGEEGGGEEEGGEDFSQLTQNQTQTPQMMTRAALKRRAAQKRRAAGRGC